MSGGMIANVTIEGIVTGDRWEYNGDSLFRIAHYRPADRAPAFLPGRRRGRSRQQADFFTVRVPAAGIPLQSPDEGDRVVVEGYLVDRQGDVSLSDFNRRAQGEEKLPTEILASFGDLTERRSITEIVATRIWNRSAGNGSGSGRRRARSKVRQATPPTDEAEEKAL